MVHGHDETQPGQVDPVKIAEEGDPCPLRVEVPLRQGPFRLDNQTEGSHGNETLPED